MAFARRCLVVALNFVTFSSQASKDPLKDFCRRWGHQTAQVDGKLYIDGGQVTWNPQSQNPLNYTNTWLLYSDLNSSTGETAMPQQYANLTKGSSVPSVSGGILWADEVNKVFHLFGGEYQSSPEDFTFWTYDTVLDQWNETNDYQSNVNSIQRVSFGAGTVAQELGLGFYYGGWLSNQSVPGWTGPPMATSHLIRYDMTRGDLNNSTGPDDIGRAEGVMLYLPASDGGLLVYFGGIEDPYANGSFIGANMSTIHIFDIASSKWYTQSAVGEVPDARRRFCAGATWADDYSSYNIYLYGGFGIENITGFDDAYILSLPSFTWIKAWPDDGETSTSPHGMTSCNAVNRDQIIIIGGWFPASDTCDSPNGFGQHNMNLGYNGPERVIWDKYDPNLSRYYVPTPILSVIGGGPTGSATATAPSRWGHPDLSVYFTRVPTFSARTATRTLPTISDAPRNNTSSGSTNVRTIAGATVGGVVGLIALLCLILFLLHRKKKSLKQKTTKPKPPTELPATYPAQELDSPGAAKYIMQQQEPPTERHPAFNESASPHARSPSNTTSPSTLYQAPYNSTAPVTTASHPSPHSNEYSTASYPPPATYTLYPEQTYPPDQHQAYNLEQYPHLSQQPQPQRQQYSYTSTVQPPQQPPYDPTQPLSQTYFPPPPDPSPTHPNSHSPTQHSPQSSHILYANPSPRLNGRNETQNLDVTEFQPTSKTTTPLHFYGARAGETGAGREMSSPTEPSSRNLGLVERRPLRGSLE